MFLDEVVVAPAEDDALDGRGDALGTGGSLEVGEREDIGHGLEERGVATGYGSFVELCLLVDLGGVATKEGGKDDIGHPEGELNGVVFLLAS